MKDLHYLIWLSRIKGLGPINIKKLFELYVCPENIWNQSKENLIKNGIKENLANEIINSIYRKDLEKYEKYMDKHNIEVITINDKEYPEKLKNIYDAPIILFIKGNKNILNNYSIAIVGCRECSNYGRNVAKEFAYKLSKNNINVISGLARGIDAAAHTGAIQANGKTIAVIGNGLDRIYPLENKQIYSKIIESGGAIISEYVIGTKPVALNFPARNRIISGISNEIIVVEATEKSGSLITVDFALEQGREVYAVPGNINSINSIGTNELIREGAKIITKIEDIFVEK